MKIKKKKKYGELMKFMDKHKHILPENLVTETQRQITNTLKKKISSDRKKYKELKGIMQQFLTELQFEQKKTKQLENGETHKNRRIKMNQTTYVEINGTNILKAACYITSRHNKIVSEIY